MREIKFRAWSKEEQKMFFVLDALWFHRPGGLWVNECRQEPRNRLYGYDGNQVEIMQYTGLHDKNGKEIYEGDIVKNHDDSTLLATVVFGYYAIGRDSWDIEFETPCFCQEWFDKSGHACIGDSIEIIGNIHDNPELLEGG